MKATSRSIHSSITAFALSLATFIAPDQAAAQQEFDPIDKYSSKFSDQTTELIGDYSKTINQYLDKKLGDLGVGGMCGIDFDVSVPVNIPDFSCEKLLPEIGLDKSFQYDVPKPDAMKSLEEFSETPEGFD